MTRVLDVAILVCLISLGTLNLLTNPFLVGWSQADYDECAGEPPGEHCICCQGSWVCWEEEPDDG